jgi:hypothetical protein
MTWTSSVLLETAISSELSHLCILFSSPPELLKLSLLCLRCCLSINDKHTMPVNMPTLLIEETFMYFGYTYDPNLTHQGAFVITEISSATSHENGYINTTSQNTY